MNKTKEGTRISDLNLVFVGITRTSSSSKPYGSTGSRTSVTNDDDFCLKEKEKQPIQFSEKEETFHES